MKIAVSGKGGRVARPRSRPTSPSCLRETVTRCWAVDADPDSSLGFALGIDENALASLKPIVEMDALIGDLAGDGALYSLNPLVNDVIDKYSVDANGIRFLRSWAASSRADPPATAARTRFCGRSSTRSSSTRRTS